MTRIIDTNDYIRDIGNPSEAEQGRWASRPQVDFLKKASYETLDAKPNVDFGCFIDDISDGSFL